MLDPIAYSYPTQPEDGDGSLVSFIGTTGLNNTGIEVQVHRWVEPHEPARVLMTLDLPTADAIEAVIEFDMRDAQGLREALRDNDRGLKWMFNHATYWVPPCQVIWMTQIAAEAWRVNARMRDLVDGALIVMHEFEQIAA